MCGITGYFSLESAADRNQMRSTADAMQKAIAHRGPDASDIWMDDREALVFTHRRLAIIDLSDDGKQPMLSASGRYVITYNGEIYNYLTLKEELSAKGCSFKTKTDTEVILVAIEHWGFEKTLQKLNGMFAFVLWDKEEKRLMFARDRFGKKPLYIGWAGNNLVFSSELKSFHVHPNFKRQISKQALSVYMQYSYVCAPYSIFENVWQLLPGACLNIGVERLQAGSDLSARFTKYWDLPSIVKENGTIDISEQEALKEFEKRLEHAVAQRMISDVPLGAFLSGGIDSSTVVALMQKLSRSPVKTFSIGFEEKDYNEATKAKAIAAHLGTHHQEFYVSANDALSVIPNMAEIYDEPFADSSQIPTHLISRLAKSQVTVALTGDGGDEILGGYERHTHIPPLWKKLGWIPAPLRQVGGSVTGLLPTSLLDKVRPDHPRFGAKIHRAAKLLSQKNPEAIYDYLTAAWQDGAACVQGGEIPPLPIHNKMTWPMELPFTETMMLSDCLSYRSDDLMVKADRASMAVALELRAPLMDYEIAEFCWQLPQNLKVRGLKGKWLLRQLQARYIPGELTKGSKQHFGAPLDEWLKGPLKEWGADLLSRERLEAQGLFDAELIHKSWNDYQAGKSNSVTPKALWTALMFQTWHDRWMKV